MTRRCRATIDFMYDALRYNDSCPLNTVVADSNLTVITNFQYAVMKILAIFRSSVSAIFSVAILCVITSVASAMAEPATKIETGPAEESTSAPDTGPAEPSAQKGSDLGEAIKAIQAQLKAQDEQIRQLQAQYQQEVDSHKTKVEKQEKLIASQASEIQTQRDAVKSLQQQVDQMAVDQEMAMTEEQKQFRNRLQTVEESILASDEQASTTYDLDSFPGSIAIPGTSAALKIGGYVKMNLVKNFDPLGSKDRFITSSIPVPSSDKEAEVSLSANPTRINLELRDSGDYGNLRAFVEGDFAGSGDSFRLRHAFGQFNSLLIGKTWSTFMDPSTNPESLDFEGMNGRILLRQPQIRFFPKIAKNWNLLLALEDTNPDITGGEGRSNMPDVVVSVEHRLSKWNFKAAMLFRKIEGVCDCLNGTDDSTNGWAVTISGRTNLSWWDERDNIKMQLNYGTGYGRYINDLANLGDSDAVFNPATGKLESLEVSAFYVSMQKWWTASIRSNFNLGLVDVDNRDYQEDSAYQKTFRLGANVIWSPTPRVDLGVELLSGRRWNKNDLSSNARQFQFAATYRY